MTGRLDTLSEPGPTLESYSYDGTGRRTLEAAPGTNFTELLYPSNSQVIEEDTGIVGTTLKVQNVYSPVYVDALVLRDYDFKNAAQGGREDFALGLIDKRNRVYSFSMARPLQADPLGYVDGMSAYLWEGGNPINCTDATGLAVMRNETPTDPNQDAVPNYAYADGRNTVLTEELHCSTRYWTRTGGSLAWRNHNPGNIRAGQFASNHGAIGTGPDPFAAFPDDATGANAIKSLLLTDTYKNLSVLDAISKYAPPSENSTANYQKTVVGSVGAPGSTLVKDLSDAQLNGMVNAIRTTEGWIPGTETSVDVHDD